MEDKNNNVPVPTDLAKECMMLRRMVAQLKVQNDVMNNKLDVLTGMMQQLLANQNTCLSPTDKTPSSTFCTVETIEEMNALEEKLKKKST